MRYLRPPAYRPRVQCELPPMPACNTTDAGETPGVSGFHPPGKRVACKTIRSREQIKSNGHLTATRVPKANAVVEGDFDGSDIGKNGRSGRVHGDSDERFFFSSGGGRGDRYSTTGGKARKS